MISFLYGEIINVGKTFLILKVDNVGYKVFVNSEQGYKAGEEVSVYTHQYIREDALDLYGFKTIEELEMFELLISISGIGPKSALGVLAVASVDDLKKYIGRGDASLLIKVSGIGKKTAERVVLELRDKINDMAFTDRRDSQSLEAGLDEIDALVALGYSVYSAREALKKIDPEIIDSGERIKAALKIVGR